MSTQTEERISVSVFVDPRDRERLIEPRLPGGTAMTHDDEPEAVYGLERLRRIADHLSERYPPPSPLESELRKLRQFVGELREESAGVSPQAEPHLRLIPGGRSEEREP